MAAAMSGRFKAIIAGSRGVGSAVQRAAASVGSSPRLASNPLAAHEARRHASNTQYYGALERHLRGSAGAKPRPVDLPYIDQVRAEHLLKLRFHIGHQRRKLDKHMGGTIYGFRHNIAIFDIAKTWKSLRTVFYAFAEMAQARSSFYLLAPNKALPLRPLIEKMRNEYPFRSNKFSSLYMVGYSDQKWVDGTFSNWKQTYAFYEHVRKVLKDKPSLQKFRRLAKYMRGIDSVDLMGRVVPDFMLVFATDRGAIHEATNLDVPLIGMVDSNTSPRPFLYPVFGNDDSLESIQFMMDVLKRAVEEGRKREHEAFAIMLVQKLKQKLNPAHATADPMQDIRDPEIDDELSVIAGEADEDRLTKLSRVSRIHRQPTPLPNM